MTQMQRPADELESVFPTALERQCPIPEAQGLNLEPRVLTCVQAITPRMTLLCVEPASREKNGGETRTYHVSTDVVGESKGEIVAGHTHVLHFERGEARHAGESGGPFFQFILERGDIIATAGAVRVYLQRAHVWKRETLENQIEKVSDSSGRCFDLEDEIGTGPSVKEADSGVERGGGVWRRVEGGDDWPQWGMSGDASQIREGSTGDHVVEMSFEELDIKPAQFGDVARGEKYGGVGHSQSQVHYEDVGKGDRAG